MFDTQGKLDIFEDFRVDRSLPKFRKPVEAQTGVITGTNTIFTVVNQGFGVMAQAQSSSGDWQRRSWWQKLADWWRDTRRVPIDQFFKSVKNGVEELELVEHRMQGYLAAIAQARANGQTALVEQLEAGVEGVRTETQLVAMKKVKFIEEVQLVEFVKKAKRGLRLDWIANFTRVIPEHVVKAKLAADDRNVFDNYVVLHFDPKKKAWSETAAEKEKRKDPILFGVIKGRRRLYFVGDWVDEFCDLTFDQVADALGKENIGTVPKDFVVEARAS
jgi:hypothetical protein